MDDLVQWLGEQLDEDERIAREAPHGPWLISNTVDPTKPCEVRTFPDLRLVADGLSWLAAEHIVRHDPARVLREIDAKRQIVQLLAETTEAGESYKGPDYYEGVDACEKTLRLLALPYADRPGYAEAIAAAE